MRAAGVTVAGSLSPQRTREFAKTVVDAGVDMFVIRGTTVSAEHVSGHSEPLNLKEFIYELDVPVIVGGCARSEEHTSELQSRQYLVCRLLLEKKKKNEYNSNERLELCS